VQRSQAPCAVPSSRPRKRLPEFSLDAVGDKVDNLDGDVRHVEVACDAQLGLRTTSQRFTPRASSRKPSFARSSSEGGSVMKKVAMRNAANRTNCHAAERPVAACSIPSAAKVSAMTCVSASPERAATLPWMSV